VASKREMKNSTWKKFEKFQRSLRRKSLDQRIAHNA